MKKKRIIRIIIEVLVLAIGLFVCYFGDYYKAKDDAMEIINGEDVIEEDDCFIFSCNQTKTGIILYPGAKVEAEAYAPLMQSLSDEGILCIIADMPANFALFDIDAAEDIQEEYPEITNWYIAGHSLGGVCASYYANRHAEDFDGLILLASYSPKDLSDTDLKVLSIYGSNDKVLNTKNYEKNLKHLPDDYTEVIIDGGNHSYFGDYGKQSGDGTATITKEEQVEITTEAIVDLISQD